MINVTRQGLSLTQDEKANIEILNKFNWNIENLVAEVISLRDKVDGLESEVDDKTNELDDVESEKEDLENEISDLKEQVGLCQRCGDLKGLNT